MEPGVGLGNPWGSLPTWDILGFSDSYSEGNSSPAMLVLSLNGRTLPHFSFMSGTTAENT